MGSPGSGATRSGAAALLELGILLAKYKVKSSVKFAWWTAEEEGLLGSRHWVASQKAPELDQIRLYLNFDMLASPNFVLGSYDGDGSDFGHRGPPGSGEVEALFDEFFHSQGWNTSSHDFDGRSDYQAFADNGIPCGGLFTGADETKTKEWVEMFGGVQGEILDPNYHTADDNYDNLNFTAFYTMTRAMAASVAEYSTSFASLPVRDPSKAKRGMRWRKIGSNKLVKKGHHSVWKT